MNEWDEFENTIVQKNKSNVMKCQKHWEKNIFSFENEK